MTKNPRRSTLISAICFGVLGALAVLSAAPANAWQNWWYSDDYHPANQVQRSGEGTLYGGQVYVGQGHSAAFWANEFIGNHSVPPPATVPRS